MISHSSNDNPVPGRSRGKIMKKQHKENAYGNGKEL